ncbi:MAG TPA: FtsX-like permease family protein [Ktedonobacterales bacterium]|nr:FtsX-like permease family protein [Ktedonobacterales bacterium]
MSTVFSFSTDGLALPLGLAAAAALLIIVIRAARAPFLARIGLRNTVRRKGRTLLVIFGLMLATTFVAAALTLDDTIVRAVKNVAVFSLGRVDEEIAGGNAVLGLYPESTAADVRQTLHGDGRVAGIAPAIAIPDLLLVDDQTRQVRGDVLGVAIETDTAGPLADVRRASDNAPAGIDALGATEVYLNRETARLLRAHAGDRVDILSTRWPGQRFRFTVLDVVTGGPLAERASVLLPMLTMQTLLGAPGAINRIYIANSGDGLSGVGNSDAIAAKLAKTLPHSLRVDTVKQDGVAFALQAQDIFGRILALYTLFALSIGLLLIFLIFALLAAERRTELGMARAVGMHRAQVVWMLLFEGAIYDVAAGLPGMLAGLALGIGVIAAVSPTIARFGFPVDVRIDPSTAFVSFCLGLLFTLATIVLAIWTVSRMTVAAALRGLPEPPPPQPALRALLSAAVTRSLRAGPRPYELLAGWARVGLALVVRGIVPALVGMALLRVSLAGRNQLLLALGISCAWAGVVLLVRWGVLAAAAATLRMARPKTAARALARVTDRANRWSFLVIGLGITLYWSLPFDALSRLGLPRFEGGIEVLFTAGIMMVLGAVLAVAPNLDVLLLPLEWLAKRLGRLRHVAYVALIYPSHQRVRTGIGLSMFSLVCFTMVVMACIAASTTQRYGDLAAQAGGYDIIGQPLFRPIGDAAQVRTALRQASAATADDVAALGTATPLPLIMLQPGATDGRWGVYPAAQVDGSFLDGQGLPLAARAQGLRSDADVWRLVREQPGNVVIDAGAVAADDAARLGITPPAPVGVEHFVAPPIASGLLGLSSLETLLGRTAALDAQQRIPQDVRDIVQSPNKLHEFTLQLSGIALGGGVIAPTPLWIADPRGGPPIKVTVVGIVDNTHGQSYGLLGSSATFAPVEQDLTPFASSYYFFRLAPGADPHVDAAAIGSALLGYGVETTVIQDALQDVNAPKVFASRVLIGLVGLTLLIGLAALAVTGTRAVVERRQQIGMLRALGYHRGHVRTLFVLESLVVAGAGTGLGLLLGLILCRNVFAVSFFEEFQSGIALVVPWPALALICAAAIASALLAAVAPAAQASRVAPADALRYE